MSTATTPAAHGDDAGVAPELHDIGIGNERTHELLAQVLERLDALPAAVAAVLSERDRGSGVSRIDRHLAAALLPEISAAVGDLGWSCKELLAHATDKDPALLAAIEGALGMNDSTGRRLGMLLARIEGFTLDGFIVEREGDQRDGATWSARREFPTN